MNWQLSLLLRKTSSFGPLKSLSPRRIRTIFIPLTVLLLFFFFRPALFPSPSPSSSPTSSHPSTHTPSPFRIQASLPPEPPAAKPIRLARRAAVKTAFLHAWNGYTAHAWLHDELLPLSGGFKDPYVGWAATLVDSLDALYILGLDTEFQRALKALDKIDFTKPNAERVPVFETTIRYLGGLLGAYDVSEGRFPLLLRKADELGEFLFGAFQTPNGIPVPYFWWGKEGEELEGSEGVLIAQIGKLAPF